MNIEIEKEEKIIELFRVLSEPNRIRIIKILRDSDRELTCGQISQSLKIARFNSFLSL
jgi:DNA-binding transcriptional ArsR family regulator